MAHKPYQTKFCRQHADVWSHPGHYLVHPPTPPWSHKSISWSWMDDSHPFHSMSTGNPIPEIRLFQTVTLKLDSQCHGCGQTWFPHFFRNEIQGLFRDFHGQNHIFQALWNRYLVYCRCVILWKNDLPYIKLKYSEFIFQLYTQQQRILYKKDWFGNLHCEKHGSLDQQWWKFDDKITEWCYFSQFKCAK